MAKDGIQGEIGSTITIKEVNTMQQILRDPDIMRQPAQRLKTFTRILFYISQGIDMSGLFSDMVLNAATKDLVEKKLIYQYLVLYAPTNVDLALLCINTFRSEFQSDNPQIRGHSLRYLSGLRVQSLLEYIVPCITKGLVDGNSYVRSVAVTGTLKIFWFSPETFENQHYFDSLFEMIRDLDPVVSGNCISVINEILESLAPIVRSLSSQSQTQSNSIFSSIITKPLIVYLLKRFSKYSVWHQTQVLKLVRRFKTEVVQDKYDIMDLLEQCFRSLNSGVVFSAAEVFLSFSQNDANLRKDVRKRLVKPLITIISVSQSPEIQLIAIKNAKQLQEEEIIIEIMKEEQLKKQENDNNNNEMKQKTKMIQSPSLFSNHFRTFFFHRKDPVYLRIAKLEILSLITDTTNWKYVAEELSEYVFDPNQTVSSLSIFTFKRISIRIPASLPLFSDCMSSVFDYYGEIGYQERMKERDQEQRGERGDESLIGKEESIAQVAIISIRDILRFHPSFFTLFIPLLGKHYYIFDTLQGKAALVNIIGQFGEHIPSAPYLLESFVEQIQNNNDDNSNTFSYFEEEKIESNDGQKEGDDSNDNKEDDEKGQQQQQQQQTSSMHSSYYSFSPPQFVLSLLQSLIRLLFLRPLEVQPVIGKLLSSIIQKAPQGVLRDQALLIYRLLLNLGVEGLNQDNKVEGDQEDDLNDNEEGIKYGDDQELKNQKKDLRSLQSLAKNLLFTPREHNINQDVGVISSSLLYQEEISEKKLFSFSTINSQIINLEKQNAQQQIEEWGTFSSIYNFPSSFFTKPQSIFTKESAGKEDDEEEKVSKIEISEQIRMERKEVEFTKHILAIYDEEKDNEKGKQNMKQEMKQNLISKSDVNENKQQIQTQDEQNNNNIDSNLVSQAQSGIDKPPLQQDIIFVPNASCSSKEFQALWKTLAQTAYEEAPLSSSSINPEVFKSNIINEQFSVIACSSAKGGSSGDIDSVRLFVYGKATNGSEYLSEVKASLSSGKIMCNVKSSEKIDQGFSTTFALMILGALM